MQHLADPKCVPKVYGPHPHAPYRANTKQMSDFFSFRYLAGGWCLSFICTKPWKGASANFFVWQFSIETFMFNASSSKPNSSTSWGTLHFTRQPRSYEVAPDLRQFHFQTLISNTSDSSSSLFHFRCSSSHPVPNGCKWYETDGNQHNLCFCLQVQ